MAGSGSSSPWGKHLFRVILMVLVALLLLHSASSQSHRDFVTPGQQKREAPVDLLSQIGGSVRGTLDAWIGAETMHLVSETLAQIMWAISSAISVAFFALSGIAAQLLNALGLEGDHITQGLKLSPGQVQTFLALLTLYALLSRLTGTRASGAQLEAKVRGLERQVEELRWRQRRAVKGPRNVEEE